MAGLRIRTANCHFENLHLPKYKKKKTNRKHFIQISTIIQENGKIKKKNWKRKCFLH